MSWTPSNCMSYWYPRLAQSGVKVPKTLMLWSPGELMYLLDGKEPAGYEDFIELAEQAASIIGYPCFMRMGHGSGKHDWKNCCWIESFSDINKKLPNLVEDQCCKDCDVDLLVLREAIQTEPMFTAFYGQMPITREFRFFVTTASKWDESEVAIRIKAPLEFVTIDRVQPYWPSEAIEGHKPSCDDWQDKLLAASTMSGEEFQALSALVTHGMEHFSEGSWSVDVLQDKFGEWWVTDMALAASSYSWEPDFRVILD